MTDEITTYSFDGFEIRTRDLGGDNDLLINARDVIFALGLEQVEPVSEWVDIVDAHRIAKLVDSETSLRFRVWLNGQLDIGPFGERAATPVESSATDIN